MTCKTCTPVAQPVAATAIAVAAASVAVAAVAVAAASKPVAAVAIAAAAEPFSPPSPSPPPPSPSPPTLTCTYTFTTKASLKTAVQAFNANPTAATATYGPIADWCVSAITDMSDLFKDLKNFDADVSSWDTSSVTNMHMHIEQAWSAPGTCACACA